MHAKLGLLSALLLLASSLSSRAELIASWNNALLDSIRSEDTPPCLAARNLAIVHGAMHDAVVAATGQGHALLQAPARAPKNLSAQAAANAAAHRAAQFVHPSRAAAFDKLYAKLRAEIEGDNLEPSEVIGRKVAQQWLEWREGDGISKTLPYIPKTEAGAWRRTPPYYRPPDLPGWRLVEPFVLTSASQFRPPGPPELASARYADDIEQVKDFGGARSTSRSAEQTQIARFWSDFSYSVTPPGHWNQIAQDITSARTVTFADKARLFAVLNLTMADVGIACWEAKFHFNFWRPVTAIRAADTDDNPATEKDSAWTSLLVTPSFPEYVSGHSAFSGAAAAILHSFVGGDSVEFSVPSDTLPGQTRRFHSLAACASEISQSRLYGGIHFPSALRDGLALGQRIAAYVEEKFSDRAHEVLLTRSKSPSPQ